MTPTWETAVTFATAIAIATALISVSFLAAGPSLVSADQLDNNASAMSHPRQPSSPDPAETPHLLRRVERDTSSNETSHQLNLPMAMPSLAMAPKMNCYELVWLTLTMCSNNARRKRSDDGQSFHFHFKFNSIPCDFLIIFFLRDV